MTAENDYSNYSDINTLKFILRVLYEHDCDDLCARLLDRFGSVSRLFDASVTELMSVRGMTERAATFFGVMTPIRRRAFIMPLFRKKFDNERAVIEFISAYTFDDNCEFDALIILDDDYNPIFVERLVEPDKFREAVAKACRLSARKIVMFRYIPFKTAEPVEPSLIRLRETADLLDIFESLGMETVDYIHYTPFEFYGLYGATDKTGAKHAVDASTEKYTTIDKMSEKATKMYNARKHDFRSGNGGASEY